MRRSLAVLVVLGVVSSAVAVHPRVLAQRGTRHAAPFRWHPDVGLDPSVRLVTEPV